MKLHLEQEINAQADKVWELLGPQFADISEWASGLEYSRSITQDEVPADYSVDPSAPILGRATPNPLGELREILIKYSDADKTFTFRGAGLPPMVSRATNTTKVTEIGTNKCLVTMDIQMDLRGPFKLFDPILRRRFATSPKGPAGVIQDLKAHSESSNAPVPV